MKQKAGTGGRAAHWGVVIALAACTGCGGGLVYRPAPEPPQAFPLDISVEQDIYRASAKKQQAEKDAAPPEVSSRQAPSEKKPSRRPLSGSPQDTICVSPDGAAVSVVASIEPNGGLFYSLHLFSYRRIDLALNDAKSIAARTGHRVFVRRTELPDSGIWHRIYVGKFADKSAAAAYGEHLKAQALTTYAAPHALPAGIAPGLDR